MQLKVSCAGTSTLDLASCISPCSTLHRAGGQSATWHCGKQQRRRGRVGRQCKPICRATAPYPRYTPFACDIALQHLEQFAQVTTTFVLDVISGFAPLLHKVVDGAHAALSRAVWILPCVATCCLLQTVLAGVDTYVLAPAGSAAWPQQSHRAQKICILSCRHKWHQPQGLHEVFQIINYKTSYSALLIWATIECIT